MNDCILKLHNLKKQFRSQWTFLPVTALDGISLEVGRGETFGFLGPNGAGKTTTIKCIVGLIHVTSGSIEIDGKEVRTAEERRHLGYLPEQPYFYDHLTVGETLDFFAALHGIGGPERKAAIERALTLVGLDERRCSPVRTLSKGLQQRLGLAQALVNRPKLLILDEPFSGLDPLGRAEVRNVLLQMKNEGTTIFMSSHILADVSDICDRVLIMNKGQVKTVFSLAEAPALFGESFQLITGALNDAGELRAYLERTAVNHAQRTSAQGHEHIFQFSDYKTASEILPAVLAKGIKIRSFQNTGMNLEQIFIKVTQQ